MPVTFETLRFVGALGGIVSRVARAPAAEATTSAIAAAPAMAPLRRGNVVALRRSTAATVPLSRHRVSPWDGGDDRYNASGGCLPNLGPGGSRSFGQFTASA